MFKGSKKLDRMEKKADRARSKTQKAKDKLPKKKEYRLERQFDDTTGKAKYVLVVNKVDKPFRQENLAVSAFRRVETEERNFVHGKIAEHEKENSAVEGAHKTEQTVERGFEYVINHHRNKELKQRKKVAKLENKQFKAEVNFQYQKFLEENPEMKKKAIQKRLQKQRIKREYAKALRKGEAAKSAKTFASKATNTATAVAKKLQEIAAKNMPTIIGIAVIGLLIVFLMTALSSCGAMLGGSVSTTMEGSYLSEPKDIDASELALTEYEMELQFEIDAIETDYPDYDEYKYDLDGIGHNPFTLISYLSAVYPEFT